MPLLTELERHNLIFELQPCGDTFEVLLFSREHDHGKTITFGNQIGFEPA